MSSLANNPQASQPNQDTLLANQMTPNQPGTINSNKRPAPQSSPDEPNDGKNKLGKKHKKRRKE